jgi:hypothetical protein
MVTILFGKERVALEAEIISSKLAKLKPLNPEDDPNQVNIRPTQEIKENNSNNDLEEIGTKLFEKLDQSNQDFHLKVRNFKFK